MASLPISRSVASSTISGAYDLLSPGEPPTDRAGRALVRAGELLPHPLDLTRETPVINDRASRDPVAA